ncbi:hypothetical protein QFC21_006243 [Naganishia friedmannii]|uniref:Uncharacterized protein n=1 Tax=Naganishia friedmannii TaxID=89922 RepID=A0ACC2V4M3_9TREE|nr:hypothetical protein QFC21_006243 [Naganishia friedmannii]
MSTNTLNFSFNPCPTADEFKLAWTANVQQAHQALESLEKPLDLNKVKQYVQSLAEFDEICSRFDLAGRTWTPYHPEAGMREESTRARDAFAAVLAAVESSSAIADNLAKAEASVVISEPDCIRLLGVWKRKLTSEGAYLSVETKAQVQRLTVAIQAKANEYSRNIQNDNTKLDFTISELQGVPQEYLKERTAQSTSDGISIFLQYFQVDKVFPALRSIVQSMFGLRFEEIVGSEGWHPSVTSFRVFDTTGGDDKLIGRIFFDLFSRDGKQDGIWATTIRKPISNSQLGEVIVAASLSNAPGARMSFEQVKDGFRPFGHCVHVLLAASSFARFSGLADIEHDFVGTSSQLLRHWMQDPQLFDFATNKDGDRISKTDLAILLKAEEIGQATERRRWMVDCQISLHIASKSQLSDVSALVGFLCKKYGKLDLPGDIHPHHGLVAVVNGFRGSRLYGRLLSEVIACDIYQEFRRPGDVDLARYRKSILEKGSSQDAKDMLRSLLGREYDFRAFGDWLHFTTEWYEARTEITK